MNTCKHDCGEEGKFQNKKGEWRCKKSSNQCEAVREKNKTGVRLAYATGKKKLAFTDQHRKKSIETKQKITLNDIFVNGTIRSNHVLKKILKDHNVLSQECSICRLDSWNDKPITLELDHIDGCNSNCKLENLRLLCPNCHSQTDTFRGRGINNSKKKVTDEELVESLKNSKNIRRALFNVGLSPRGANYARAHHLLATIK